MKTPNGDNLDFVDLKILSAVQRDGRMSVVELAEQVNLSKTPCLKRLKKLENAGYIRGYQAQLDPRKLDQGYLVFVQVKLTTTTLSKLEAFNDAVRLIPEVQSCHMMSGGYDYLLKVRTRDMDSYRILLGDVISSLPGVGQTSTFPVMEEVKDSMALAIRAD
ncbi:MAG: winged helix-turn-helix transcriptional regulator [Sphingomonadales bacterium]|nr:winged helix-turn-helix transcriptional regulator [Sphingomonadales bacterium]